MMKILRQLEERKNAIRDQLASKARTDSLDELRFTAGIYAGLQEAIRLIDQSLNQEKSDG